MYHVPPETSRSSVGRGVLFNEDGCPVYLYTGSRFPPLRLNSDRREDDSPESSELFEVRIINNDYNTYDEVIQITMLALAVDRDRAFAVAWEVDHRGYCVVAQAPRPEAEAVARMIRTIGIEVQVNPVAADSA